MKGRADPIYVDNSTLSAVAKCPTKAVLRYGLGYTSADEFAYTKAGTAGHATVEQWLKGNGYDAAMQALVKEYYEYGTYEVLPNNRLFYDNVAAIMGRWLDTHPLDSLPYVVSPDLVEVGFAVPLDEEGHYVLTGRLDAAVQIRGGKAWFVLDTKTTSRLTDQYVETYQLDSQMSGYIWALQQLTDEPVVGAFINVIIFDKLPSDAKRKCREHGVVYAECGPLHAKFSLFRVDRSPEQLEDWRQEALSLAQEWEWLFENYCQDDWREQMPKVSQRGMFNRSCQYCEFKDFCIGGRRTSPAHFDSQYIYQPWKPYEMVEETTNGPERGTH